MAGLAAEGEPGTDALAGLNKLVFSTTLTEPLAWPNTQLVARDAVVGLQVRGDVILGWVRVLWQRKGHPRKAAVLRRSEQGERVPSGPPHVPGLGAGIQDHEPQATLREAIADGKTGLTATDDDDVERRCSDL
jgi:hypothetical protein